MLQVAAPFALGAFAAHRRLVGSCHWATRLCPVSDRKLSHCRSASLLLSPFLFGLEFSGTMLPSIHIRHAVPADIPSLRVLIDASVRQLQAQDYTPTQIEGSLRIKRILSRKPGRQNPIRSPSAAAAGASARHSTAATIGPDARMLFSIRDTMPPKFVPFSSIRRGHAAESAAWFSKLAKTPRDQRGSSGSKWVPLSPV